jgi:HlyD family secretion protein
VELSSQSHQPGLQAPPTYAEHEKVSEQEAHDSPSSPEGPKKGKIGVWIIAAVIAAAAASYGLYRFWLSQQKTDAVTLSGRVEGYETKVSARMGGKVTRLAVREGDSVSPGQVIAEIDDADLRAQLQAADARVRVALQNLARTQQQLPIVQSQLEQSKLAVQQVEQESQGRVTEFNSKLSSATSRRAELQEELKLAQSEQRRTEELFARGAVSARQLEQDRAKARVALARVKSSDGEILSTQGALAQAQARLRDTPIRAASVSQGQKQLVQARTDIESARHELQEAQARRSEIQARLNYLKIKSPVSGTVITRSAEPGEVVAEGTPLLTLVNLNQLHLRGFVPAGQMGQIRIGQKGLVYLDSAPNQPLRAKVSRIDPEASFTPKNVYFKKDRVTQVFGVQLTLDNPQSARPGMAADAEILTTEQP